MSALEETPLLDADARRDFVERLNENFCVSAGAGVGKTTAITRRIANLALEGGKDGTVLPRLVVVTYGRLAAEELRVRTRDLILQSIAKGGSGRQTLLTELRGAFFGTIHGFCLKLLREHGRHLGLPENVDLLEERAEAALWERFCEGEAIDAVDLPAELLTRVTRHVSFDELLELARAFDASADESACALPTEIDPPPLDFALALDDSGGRSKERTKANQQHLSAWIEEYENGAPFLELPEYKDGSGSFKNAVEAALEPYARWLNAAAGALAARVARAFCQYRLAKGLLNYRDQIYWCRRLLNDPPVLERLRARGYRVILDEAQDTDAEMFAILTEIVRPANAVPGEWPLKAQAPGPEPGRFCFVGDVQQAIYGERANLDVYAGYVTAFREGRGGRHLEFSVTMRCPERVIGVVNGIFADGRIVQSNVEFRRLAGRPGCPTGAAWVLDLKTPEAAEMRSIDDRIAAECRQLAEFVVAQGRAGLGLAHWSELALIAPRVAWLETAAAELTRLRVPCYLLSPRRVAREIAGYSWPAALFHVLVHPWDRFEAVGVLRDIFAVSDVDLARAHRGGDVSTRLGDAQALLAELRATMPTGGGTLGRWVESVLERTALAARLEVIGESAAALRDFRAGALRAECAGLTVRDWVRDAVDALRQPVAPQEGAPGAVQLVTCQKAKGLEWPVVLPLGLACEINEHRRGYPRVEATANGVTVHFSAVTTDARARVAQQARRAEELQRMLYVTLTRAKRLLIMPDGRGIHPGKPPNFLELANWVEVDVARMFDPPPGQPAVRAANDAASGAEAASAGLFVEDAGLLAQAAKISQEFPRRILPSSLAHRGGHAAKFAEAFDGPNDGSDGVEDRLLATEVEPAGDLPLEGIGGIEYGNWWHGVLEGYPWSARDSGHRAAYLERALNSLAPGSEMAARATEDLRRFAGSVLQRELLEAGEVFLPESPFSHPRAADEWLEGIMDLAVVTRGGKALWIADWKTDRRRPSDASDAAFLQRLRERYAPQLRAYAEVFARGLGRRVDRILIYSTALGEAVEIDAD